MSKYKVGDSFIITIAEVSEGAQSKNPLYRIQGFDSLTFNDRGLDKLDKVRDEDVDAFLEAQYKKGYEEGSEVSIKKLAKAYAKGYSRGEQETRDAINKAKKEELKELDEYIEHNLIKVGDEVIITLYPESPYKAIVTAISTRLIEVIDGYGMSHNIDTFLHPNIIEKTGKKYDISKMLRDLRGILP